MKEKYFSSKLIILIIILLTCLFLFSFSSLALIPGDFGSANNGPPDGVVDFEDLMIFALAYGSTPADANWNLDCDIYPDDKIDFEDLMIFAMHYGEYECIPPSAPNLSDPGSSLPSPATYTVSWSAVSGATSYVLQEATSSNFSSGLQEYPLADTSKNFSHTVSTDITYYYRVAAIDSCGQGDWSNVEDIDIASTYNVRDIGPAGGWIFYDKGSFSDGWRYLEALPFDMGPVWPEWGSSGTLIGGTEWGIGTGQSNTTKIVTWLNSHSETNRAAQWCDALVYGGYDDWFLPSMGELFWMYSNLRVYGVGNFTGGYYWSSTEWSDDYAWYQAFYDGSQHVQYKISDMIVRPARAF